MTDTLTAEQALGLTITERTRFRVRMRIIGESGRERTAWIRGARSIHECQTRYVAKREHFGLGGSRFLDGDVFDESGQLVARISYNGRCWHPAPWTPDSKPVAEAPPR